MTLLSVVQDVCATNGVLIPQSLFSNISANRTMQEMLALANEMAQRIAYDTCDWTMLKTFATHTGDGTTLAFNLPANFKRMLLTSNVWGPVSKTQPMKFVPNTDEWMQRRSMDRYNAWGEWTIMGGQIYIFPCLAVGATARYAYIDKNAVTLASGGFGNAFLADGDSFRLDERLLKLGMVWQWKAQKGSAYAEDMGTYGDALTYAMGHDSPAPIIVGAHPISGQVSTAYPWNAPTP